MISLAEDDLHRIANALEKMTAELQRIAALLELLTEQADEFLDRERTPE